MSSYFVQETFFRPDEEYARETRAIPARIHNAMRLLLKRAGGSSLFVPIRSMQYLAVIESDEVLFVDALGGYAHHRGEGGRLIRLAWRPMAGRNSLSAPVFCEMVYYFRGLEGVRARLLSEIGPALDRVTGPGQGADIKTWNGQILPFKRID
ncbi:hypothetical protein [Thiocystis violacea]|uniref:hypothetical protein n=1 Tax=Thiocystis violacea TaxID=13725 RepID=UPI0019048B05|nr:hypothetical protein [Thiocystis violacea]